MLSIDELGQKLDKAKHFLNELRVLISGTSRSYSAHTTYNPDIAAAHAINDIYLGRRLRSQKRDEVYEQLHSQHDSSEGLFNSYE